MPRKTKFIERRHESRFETSSRPSIRVHIQRSQPVETLQAELINLSPSGAKISLSTVLRFSEVVRLRIQIPRLGINVDVNSAVRWVRPAHDNQWIFGCSFAHDIAESVLDQLATAGLIERRRDPRHSVRIPGFARYELVTETIPIEVRNYSDRGFCIASSRLSTVGTTVRVTVNGLGDSSRSLYGEVCWQAEQDGEYLLGCMIKSNAGAEILRHISSQMSDDDQRETALTPTG